MFVCYVKLKVNGEAGEFLKITNDFLVRLKKGRLGRLRKSLRFL